MKTADGQVCRGEIPGREQMNLKVSEGITGRSADGLHQNVGRAALSLTLITRDGGALRNMGETALFHRTFAIMMDKFTTAFHI